MQAYCQDDKEIAGKPLYISFSKSKKRKKYIEVAKVYLLFILRPVNHFILFYENSVCYCYTSYEMTGQFFRF